MENLSIISNIILSSLSFILAAISIVFVIITLRQNKKIIQQTQESIEQSKLMIESSTRPYLSLYIDSITTCEQQSFFILKNFGSTPATITEFEYEPILKETEQKHILMQNQFDFIRELTLSPGQKKLIYYDVTKLSCDTLTFKISYISPSNLRYTETITLNVKNYIHFPVSRPNGHILAGNERQVHTLREMLERTM